MKNEVHGSLQAHLVPKCPHADLFNRRVAPGSSIREIDRLAEDLADLDQEIAREAVDVCKSGGFRRSPVNRRAKLDADRGQFRKPFDTLKHRAAVCTAMAVSA
ncbi:hypothetical protein [Mesorhizobium prunaredense]|uniref:hypothetical protein n=1 Tax=Mesorhizobium prunaredense TaxID=1631249 RepID=UPI001FCCEA14|nr:hypothetical protein [Mesorhizobium prunaredense]